MYYGTLYHKEDLFIILALRQFMATAAKMMPEELAYNFHVICLYT